MDCKHCGYCWADIDEDGVQMSLEYCHFDGPDDWAPCVQEEYNEYANEAEAEARDAEEEAAFEAWLEALPVEQRPTNTKEYIDMWAYFKQAQSQYEEFDYWEDSMEQAGYCDEDEIEEENLYDDEDIEFERYEDWIDNETQRELDEEWEDEVRWVHEFGQPYDYEEF